MTRDQVIDLVRAADPASEGISDSDGFPSMTALLDRIDERSTDMQTRERNQPDTTPPPRRQMRLIAALAGAVGVIAAIVLVASIIGDRGRDTGGETTVVTSTSTTAPDAAAPTPTEVGQALNAAATSGDWERAVGFFAEGATLTRGNGADEGFVRSLSEPVQDHLFAPPTRMNRPFDWDGDLVRSGSDAVAHHVMWAYALGFSFFDGCTETGPSTLTCQIGWNDHPLGNGAYPGFAQEHTIVDGMIADSTWPETDIDGAVIVDAQAAAEYETWVRANRSELNEDGALFRLNPGDLVISPDTVEIHRQLIAEWVAER